MRDLQFGLDLRLDDVRDLNLGLHNCLELGSYMSERGGLGSGSGDDMLEGLGCKRNLSFRCGFLKNSN